MSLFERFVIGVDIQKYSGRNTRRQVTLQRELDRMLDDAAESAGISRRHWQRRAEGDGEIAALPPDVDLLAVVGEFVGELDRRLMDHNEDYTPEMRIRLRVAMHSDVMTNGQLGSAGPALIVLARLLNSAPVRAALDETPDAHLAQIISEPVYQKVVLSGLGGLRPRQFRKVLVRLPDKDFQQTAYVHVPGDSAVAPVGESDAGPKAGPNAGPKTAPKAVTGGIRIPRPVRSAPEPAEPVPAATERRPSPEPEIAPAVWDMVRQVRAALAAHRIDRADTLTTLALAESAGRGRNGWLRESDGERVPLALLTELDEAWADSSDGTWGFQAQRQRLTGLALSGRREFREVCVRFGWRTEQDEIAPAYPLFSGRAEHARPFYPTLRNPARENFPEWHDEWASTVMSIHLRLRESE